MQRIIKPKNQRVKRALEERAPKLVENSKKAMFIRGAKVSEVVSQAMKEMYALKKPEAILYKRKNVTRPFEDVSSVEFFSNKSDSSLFMYGSHNKKRPHNLVIGRLHDHHILDMVELGVLQFKSSRMCPGEPCVLGSKPCLLFSGDMFETDSKYTRLKNMFIDFFRGVEVKKIRLAGLDHVITFTVSEKGLIFVRVYRILLKKSGSRLPRVELVEMGPSLDLEVRRSKLADQSTFKKACRQPKATKVKKTKNVSFDTFGSKLGRVHMQRQDLSKLQTRKLKGLKRSRPSSNSDPPLTTKKSRLTSSEQ